MASFKPSKKGYTEFNGGEKYRNNIDSPSATDFNNVIENILILNEESDVLYDDIVPRITNAEASIKRLKSQVEEFPEIVQSEISETKKKVENLYARTFPEIDVIDSSVAYQRIVPIGALPYAEVAKVGGMSHKSVNLIPFPYDDTTKEVNGVTFTVNGDGSITANGTATKLALFTLGTNMKLNGTCRLTGCPEGGGNTTCSIQAQIGGEWLSKNHDFGTGVTLNDVETIDRLVIVVESGATISNLKFYPMLNKGDTALPYTPYFDGLRHAKVTEIKSIGANHIKSTATSRTINGITFTVNADKSISVNGTANDLTYYTVGKVNLSQGTYHLSGGVSGGSYDRWFLYVQGKDSYDYGDGASLEVSETLTKEVLFRISQGAAVNGVIKPMLNRGTSALPYAPYTESSLPIPSEVQDDGYGRGVNENCYNYVDWKNKQFVQRVGVVDLGTLDWRLSGTSRFYSILQSVGKPTGDYNIATNAICSIYPNLTLNALYSGVLGVSIQPINAKEVWVYDDAYTDTASFKAAMAGVMLVYELATPEVIDISHLLPDDNFIRVEGGGTITAVNEYGLAAPITINYQVD